MDLRQLACFVAVVDHDGFTRAAASLGVSQPAVSAQVRRLEREVGADLFERAGRAGARLTLAGEAALGPARAALGSTDGVRAAVAGVTGLLSGRLALGHVGSGATTTLAAPLARFHEAHPAVSVGLVEDRSEALVEALLDGTVDLAWIGLAGDLPAGLDGRTVLDERVVVAVPSEHPWAGRASVALADVAAHPIVTLPRGTGARAALDRGLRGLGGSAAEARIAFECSPPDLLRALVERGAGVGVLPEPLVVALGLTAVPVRRPALRSRLVLAWRAGGPSTPAAQAFLGFVAG